MPYSLALNGIALLLTLAIAIPLGVAAGGRPEGLFDRASGSVLFALYSLPAFWAALLLQTLFAVKLRWLPLYGVASDAAPTGFPGLLDRLAHMALPVVCLTYGSLAFFARIVRAGVAEARNADYVLAARARGMSRRGALWRHALRNALLPLITLLALVLPALLSGSVIIERIFAWPGLGRLYFDSILSRDYPVVLALSLIGALATLAATLAADIAYAAADPARARRNGAMSDVSGKRRPGSDASLRLPASGRVALGVVLVLWVIAALSPLLAERARDIRLEDRLLASLRRRTPSGPTISGATSSPGSSPRPRRRWRSA